jgi:hypothetical protein
LLADQFFAPSPYHLTLKWKDTRELLDVSGVRESLLFTNRILFNGVSLSLHRLPLSR